MTPAVGIRAPLGTCSSYSNNTFRHFTVNKYFLITGTVFICSFLFH